MDNDLDYRHEIFASLKTALNGENGQKKRRRSILNIHTEIQILMAFQSLRNLKKNGICKHCDNEFH